MIEQHFSVKYVAEKMAITPKTVQRLIAAGKLSAIKTGSRKFSIPESGLTAWAGKRALPATAKKKTA